MNVHVDSVIHQAELDWIITIIRTQLELIVPRWSLCDIEIHLCSWAACLIKTNPRIVWIGHICCLEIA